MSNRNWLHLVAIAGLTLLLAACGEVSGSWPIPNQFEQQANDAKYGERCDETQEDGDRDVCQQWRMALAAESMFTIALVQTGILIAALVFSIWAARAASDQARIARISLEEDDRPHLLIHFEDSGAQTLLWGTEMLRPTTLVFHNYGKSPGYLRAHHVKFSARTKAEGFPPPLDWRRTQAVIEPFGVIVPQEKDSDLLTFDARNDVPKEVSDAIDYRERDWYMQGILLYSTMDRVSFVYGFTFKIENGIWHVGEPDWRKGHLYNWNDRHYPEARFQRFRRWLATRLARAAVMIEPRAPK